MADSDDDEDTKRAIALSLQATESKLSPAQSSVINLDEDELPGEDASTITGLPASGFLGLDRKKMEQERLARKRKASISPPPPQKAKKMVFENTAPPNNIPTQLQSSSGLAYPRGVVKKTWSSGHPRVGNDIKLDEALQKDDLQVAVLSSFQWEMSWLLAKINPTTRTILVMEAKENATKERFRRDITDMPYNLKLCFPSMEGQINCMHSKLMLLSHPTYLRIAVPTANLVTYDWGEGGTMENMVFLIDLPRLEDDKRAKKEEMTFFGQELVYFLEAMGLEKTIVDSLYKFDFSATKDLAFVHTIGGAHSGAGNPWRRTGYCGLGRAIRHLGLVADTPIGLDFVTSSVGSLKIDFLNLLYGACKGDDALAEYNSRVPTKRKKGEETISEAAVKAKRDRETEENFRIYFPTRDTVRSSRAGFAGTICFQSKWWNAPTFPKKVLRDCKSVREGMLMHNKLIFVQSKHPATTIAPPANDTTSSPSPTRTKAWIYIGSANCSESAWGNKLTQDRSKVLKLNCRNWECGVIVPVVRGENGDANDVAREDESRARKDGSEVIGKGSGELEEMRAGGNGVRLGPGAVSGEGQGKQKDALDEVFRAVVPVPMQTPGAAYGAKTPWFYAVG